LLSGKGPAATVAILSNGALTLYWCIRCRFRVTGFGLLRRFQDISIAFQPRALLVTSFAAA
jgi:hypothetical protein